MRGRIRVAAFVGRAPELAALEDLAATVTDTGHGRMIVVGGDAGVGKTRLITEFATRSRGAGWTVAQGSCVDLGESGLTHAALTELLRRLHADLGEEALSRLAGEGLDELGRFLPGGGGRPVVGGGRLLEQVLSFFGRLGRESATLVVFEDLQWSDTSTRDLIMFLARNLHAARVLAVATYRSDDLHRRHPLRPWLAELERGGAAALQLKGLDRRDVAQLAAGALGRQVAAERIAALTQRTDGNPLYVEELLESLDTGSSLPGGLRDLLLARLHGLPDGTLDVLRPAALLGRQIHEQLLEAVTATPAPAIEAALRDAVAHQILELEGGICRFRHDLVCEAIYDDLLPAQRHRMHLERLALVHQQLGIYLWILGESASSAAEHERAVASLDNRLPSQTKAFVLARFAQHLMLNQPDEEALRFAGLAVDMARQTGDRRIEGHALCTKGVVLGCIGRLEESLQSLREARHIAAEVGHSDDLSRSHQNLTYVQLFAGLAEEAMIDAAAGLEIVRRQGTMLRSGIGITEHQAEAAVRLGRWDEALALLDRFPYDDVEGMTLCSLAAPRFDVAIRRGDLEAAATALAPAIQRAITMDDAQFGANTRIRAAQLALATGRLDEARQWIAEALAITDQTIDLLYAPRACWVGIAVEAARPLHADLGAADLLLERVERLEAQQRSLGGTFLAEPAAFVSMARAEHAELRGQPHPDAWAEAGGGVGRLRRCLLGRLRPVPPG